MKQHKTINWAKRLLLGTAICVSSTGQTQELFDLMNQDGVNLQEVQDAAEVYFEEHGTGTGSGYKLFKRWEYHAQTNLQEDGTVISREKLAEAVSNDGRNSGGRAISASNWQELGPLAWTNTSGYNPGVGRVTTIAVEKSLQQTIFVGSPGGGLWRSLNGGSSWTPVGDDFDNMEIWAVEIDPVYSNRILVGDAAGDLYISWNTGDSFNKILDKHGRITDILINPSNFNEMHVAFRFSGLWRTTNGGATWTQVISEGVEDVMYKPGSTSTVYACGERFHRSTNGGVSFTTITTGILSTDRMKMAVTPDDDNYIYIIQKRGSQFGYLYRSTDGGTSFTTQIDYNTANYVGQQAHRDMAVAVSPTDKNEVHMGGFNMFKSTNGGTTWVTECDWFYPSTVGGAFEYVHADIEVMHYIDGNLYVGSDGGIFKSANGGDDFTDLSTGLGIHQFYNISSSATDKYVVAGGSQDNGQNVMGTAAHTWKHWGGADGMDCSVHPTNSNIIYGALQFGSVRKTEDGGITHASYIDPPETGTGNWVTPFDIDPNNGSRIYVGYLDIYRNDNGGNSAWVNMSTGIDFGGDKLSHIETCPSNSEVLYVATLSNLYRCDNATSASPTWTALSGTTGVIDDIAVDPHDETRVVVASSFGDMFLSTNSGSTWTNITGSLPDVPFKAAVLDRSPNNGIYVAMKGAVYYKSDIVPWTLFATNLPKVAVTDMDLFYGDAGESRIRLGTYGRGLWESPLYDDAQDVVCSSTISSNVLESFESSDLGGWTQNSDDDFNWESGFGGTPSPGTGPASANHGSSYLYMEVDAPNHPNKQAILTSPCIDLTGYAYGYLFFKYQMFGSAVGTLKLEASLDGSTWTELWSRSGSQGSAEVWQSTAVVLNAYAGQNFKLRFNGTSGTSWQGDIAIDKLQFSFVPGGAPLPGFEDVADLENDFSMREISVFPNPVSSILNVQLPTNGEVVTLSLVDLAGKVVGEQTYQTHDGLNLLKVNTEDIAAGSYVLHIQKGESILTEKILIRR